MLAIISVPGISERAPGVPGLGEETEIFSAVNSRARSLPEYGRLDQLVPARLQSCQQPVRAFRLLGGALDDAANQEELRIVAPMQFGVDRFHSNAPDERMENVQAHIQTKLDFSRFMISPAPLSPTILPLSTTTRPRAMVMTGHPVISKPSQGV